MLYSFAKSLHRLAAGPSLSRGTRLGCNPSALVRHMATFNCGVEDHDPRCDTRLLKRPPCTKSPIYGDPKPIPRNEFKSMWENPDCCKSECPDQLPRFDALYYKITDKGKRKYTQTWVECPDIQIKPKKICCFEHNKLPPMEKRPPGKRPYTACCPLPNSRDKAKCKNLKNLKCFKITLPGCRGARNPPRCFSVRLPTDCKKVKAPYPSFSECKRPKPCPLRPRECGCLINQSLCEVWVQFRRNQLYGIKYPY